MSTLYYRTLAYIFYYLGDLFCRIPLYYAYDAYQYCMRASIRYDDLSGKRVWKEYE
jgi:hypothetical protein